jgi:hypothetical protein
MYTEIEYIASINYSKKHDDKSIKNEKEPHISELNARINKKIMIMLREKY